MNLERLARHIRVALLLLVVGLLAARPGWSSDTYTPPPETQTWKGVIRSAGATAQVLLQCSHPGSGDTASIRVSGLKPNGVYSFWLLGADGSRRGLGKAPYQARADASGSLTYKPALGFCPSGSSLTVVVNYHPSSGQASQALKGTVSQQ